MTRHDVHDLLQWCDKYGASSLVSKFSKELFTSIRSDNDHIGFVKGLSHPVHELCVFFWKKTHGANEDISGMVRSYESRLIHRTHPYHPLDFCWLFLSGPTPPLPAMILSAELRPSSKKRENWFLVVLHNNTRFSKADDQCLSYTLCGWRFSSATCNRFWFYSTFSFCSAELGRTSAEHRPSSAEQNEKVL